MVALAMRLAEDALQRHSIPVFREFTTIQEHQKSPVSTLIKLT